ncbi:alpha/beta hydrolase [Rhizobium sp. BK376]|uniref:alpha/beta fold hydrolase n=1 Tax=Rhizobium sp. BK376 TaxID=2512149 RepID=UPI001051818C|nr:alpha/beta hydrolase [Rhizobium sp. BK376]TCR76831.1 pimeloyl-ACP methyl ester carboxylesterase [Rhizobium sp. BK376]
MSEPFPSYGDNARSFQEHRIEHGQGKLYVRDYPGAGPAFVMMHGFPDNLGIYDFLVPHLVDAGRRVVTFDFLGFGASDKPEGAKYSFAQQQGDLKRVVEALKLGKIVPVVHDSGGFPGLNFAIDQPDDVAELVILNCVYHAVPDDRLPELIEVFATVNLREVAMMIAQNPEFMGSLLNLQRSLFQAALPERHVKTYVDFLGPLIDANFGLPPSSGPAFVQMTAGFYDVLAENTKRLPLLNKLEVPTKVIWGERDPYLTTATAKDFHGNLQNSTLHLIDAGHWVQIDEGKKVAEIMLS